MVAQSSGWQLAADAGISYYPWRQLIFSADASVPFWDRVGPSQMVSVASMIFGINLLFVSQHRSIPRMDALAALRRAPCRQRPAQGLATRALAVERRTEMYTSTGAFARGTRWRPI